MPLQDTSAHAGTACGSTSEAFGCFPLGVHSPAGPRAGEEPMQGEQHRAEEPAAAPVVVSPLQLAISSFALLFSALKKLLCKSSALPSLTQFTV